MKLRHPHNNKAAIKTQSGTFIFTFDNDRVFVIKKSKHCKSEFTVIDSLLQKKLG